MNIGKGIQPMKDEDSVSANAVKMIDYTIEHGGVTHDLNYSRTALTAIGGTLQSFGRNVYWQLVVDKVQDLPEKPTAGIKAFVRSSKSVYDATESGWKWNLSDTKFISGLEIEPKY